jgi:hypothetical protein
MIFDFSGRFQSAFGFSTTNVSTKLKQTGFEDILNDKSKSGLDVYVNNASSTFDEVTIRRDEKNALEEYKFACSSLFSEDENIFALPPMLSLTRNKNLVVTPIDNADFEVVERWGNCPWDITWRGLLIDMENHNFPLDKMKKLNDIFNFNGVWNVDSKILNNAGVLAFFIKDISIDFVEGFEDTIAYSFTMRQIKPIENQIID